MHLRADLDARKVCCGLIARIAAAADTGRDELEARLLDRAREIARRCHRSGGAVAASGAHRAAVDISEE